MAYVYLEALRVVTEAEAVEAVVAAKDGTAAFMFGDVRIEISRTEAGGWKTVVSPFGSMSLGSPPFATPQAAVEDGVRMALVVLGARYPNTREAA